jgi:hypothetical protein
LHAFIETSIQSLNFSDLNLLGGANLRAVATMASTSTPKPFQISIPDSLLSFINSRVSTARIPPGLEFSDKDAWSYGVPAKTMEELKSYWETKYDWRAVEKKINGHLKMFTMTIE